MPAEEERTGRRFFLHGRSSPASQYAAYNTTPRAVSVIRTTITTIPTMTSYPPTAKKGEILQGLLHGRASQLLQSPGPRHPGEVKFNFLPGQHYEPIDAPFA